MGLRDAIRALLDGDETDDTGEIEEIERGVAEGAADEVADEDADDADGIGEAEADEGEEIESGDEGADEVEGTPGDEDEESAEDADLRATIIEQAELIESLRNRLAAAGIEDDIEDVADAVDTVEDETADTDEDLVVQSFEDDYSKREAALAEIKEN